MSRAKRWLVPLTVAAVVGAWAVAPAAGAVRVGVRVAAADEGDKAKAQPDKPKPKTQAKGKAKSKAKVKVQVAPAERAGWLGIRMGAVPKAVAAHLGLKKDEGVIVRNVVVGGPADRAGLDRYDVIVRVDGQQVDLGSLAGEIRKRKPGEKVTFEVIHQGRRKKVEIVLAKPIAVADAKMKYEEEPETVWQDRWKWQGNLLRKGPEGWRVFGGKGPTADIDKLLKSLPQWGQWQMEFELDKSGDGFASWTVKRTRDGKTIELQRHKDGRFTVTRSETDEDGKTGKVSRTYKNEADLRKNDAEAHRMYREIGGPYIRLWSWPKLKFDLRVPEGVRKQTDKMMKEAEQQRKEWQKDLEKQLAEAERRRKEAQARIDKLRREMEEAMKKMPGKPLFPRDLEKMMRGLQAPAGRSNEGPVHEFMVDVDGSIEVRVRGGDDELTMKFKSEEDLKAKRPKLYEHYRTMLKRAR